MTPPTPLILFPCGGNAREAVMAVEALNRIRPTWELVGFIDDDEGLRGSRFGFLQVLGGREQLLRHPEAKVLALPGNPKTFRQRRAVIERLGVDTDRYATIVDPRAVVADDAEIGVNSLVMAHTVVSTRAQVGDHGVVLPNTVVSHDVRIGAYTMVGSNVSISGGCRIEEGCYIGSGSRIREGTRIGAGSLVGLGACVVKDVAAGATVAGNPARPLPESPTSSNRSGRNRGGRPWR